MAHGRAIPGNTGITLVELALVVLVLAVLATVGTPALQRIQDQSRTHAEQHRLTTSLYAARQHAVLQRSSVVVCRSAGGASDGCGGGGGWDSGWLVFEDPHLVSNCIDSSGTGYCHHGGRLLLAQGAVRPGVAVTNNHNVQDQIRFNARGFSPGYNGRFSFCISRENGTSPRGIVISNSGRTRPARQDELLACPGAEN